MTHAADLGELRSGIFLAKALDKASRGGRSDLPDETGQELGFFEN
jgi:hypothetical protein